jgi:hydrogenase maturation protease
VTGRTLVAGVGNIFLGDDGFGVEVARRLAGVPLPEHVRVADYGISGMHLAYDVADGYELAILVDAAPRGGEPGTVTVLEVEPQHRRDLDAAGPLAGSMLFDAHGMQPDIVLGTLQMLGAAACRVLVVGCEPASIDYRIGLSEPVDAAVAEAVRIVTGLVTAEPAAGLPAEPPAGLPAEPAAGLPAEPPRTSHPAAAGSPASEMRR